MDNDELTHEVLTLRKDFSGLCELFRLQQEALEKLGLIVEGHQLTLEAASGYQPPDPRKGSRN